jgi:glycosyltransferase involved in cell wall biosynthesis
MNLLVLNWLDRENPRAGGAEVHLHESFGRLADRGWTVTAVTSGWPGAASRVRLDGIDVHRTGTRNSYLLAAPRYVRGALADRRFDLTVEDLNKAPLFSPLWAPGAHVLLVHHLFGATGFQSASAPVALVTWLLERGIPRAYRSVPTIAVSRSTRADLIGRGLAPERVQVIENGVDTSHFVPLEKDARYPSPTLLYLGRLKKYKRVDLILRAVAILRDREPERSLSLIVAGDGDDRTRLHRLARELELAPETVTFLGLVSEEKKLELLQRAWVNVFTSEKEGWGITNLEAAACGTPSVVSDSPGLRDSVLDGRTGFLVPHEDVAGLADKLQRLLSDGDLRATMGSSARRFAATLSWDATTDRLARALQGAVASSGVEG